MQQENATLFFSATIFSAVTHDDCLIRISAVISLYDRQNVYHRVFVLLLEAYLNETGHRHVLLLKSNL